MPTPLKNARRKAVTAGLLVLVFGAAAFGCAAGWSGDSPKPGGAFMARKGCARKKPVRTAGFHVLHSSGGRCSLRSLTQGDAVEFAWFEISSPLIDAKERASVPRTTPILISSTGSPESDRGPPRS